jgi:hypothetical protein
MAELFLSIWRLHQTTHQWDHQRFSCQWWALLLNCLCSVFVTACFASLFCLKLFKLFSKYSWPCYQCCRSIQHSMEKGKCCVTHCSICLSLRSFKKLSFPVVSLKRWVLKRLFMVFVSLPTNTKWFYNLPEKICSVRLNCKNVRHV